MPIVNIMKKLYKPHFSTITPCSTKYFVTIAAGIPMSSAKSPPTSNPGVIIVAFIGSSILNPSETSPKPCQRSSAFNIHESRSSMPSSDKSSGPQTLNHQSLPHSSSIFRIARRKSNASAIDSSTNAVPPGCSIIAAATSQEAIIEYCGEVDVCIKYASLKASRSNFCCWESCTKICDAWLKPASNLCVDCVAKIIEFWHGFLSAPMAW